MTAPPSNAGPGPGPGSADRGDGFRGLIGRTLGESQPWWPPRRAPPAGAPDIVVVLLDDLGFSDLGCFGAEIRTPAIDRLASRGLRFANYTTVPMCTPARAALLTGKNPHAVGCGWLTFNDPGYPGYRAGEIAQDAPTLAELLRATGYSTYAVGKWHNTAEHNVLPSGDRGSWPLARGFDRFYGFLGGETHYFAPAQLVEDNTFLDHDVYRDGYYCTDDWTDRAVGWLRAHTAATPGKPLFLYVAHNAPHAPLHAKAEDLARYAGMYDAGWDAIRAARLERQCAQGLFAQRPVLPERSPGVPPWTDIDPGRRRLFVRYMELYAAIVDNIDQNIGRLADELATLGRLDNTLFLITSDNGANGIGGIEGAANNLSKRLVQAEDPQWVRDMLERGRLGGSASWPAYPLGWTDVSSAPFRLYKTTTMNGGIRVPLIAHWPDRLRDAGEVRPQWVHVTDIVPTVLDWLGIDYPAQFNGLHTRGLDGVSFRAALEDPARPPARRAQHYELAGNRGYVCDGWKIVSLQPPGTAMDLDNWMLFDLTADPTETRDLAAKRRDKLHELVAAFEEDAYANGVYPLDNRGVRRSLTVPPYLEAALQEPRTFLPGAGTAALAAVAPLVADRDYALSCAFTWSPSDHGVVFALGDPIAGMALFVRDGVVSFAYHGGQGKLATSDHLPAVDGDNRFELQHRALGGRKGLGTLRMNDAVVANLDMSPTTILGLGVGEGLDVGRDRRLHVTDRYGGEGACVYTGHVMEVRIVPGPQAPDSYANRPERLAQRD
ncbi:MAG: arylsulfatase [Casimicrobiaceae bacterium]